MQQTFFITYFFQPILNLVIFLYNIVPGHDLGVTIILLTVIIKAVLLPLSKSSIKSQKALQDLQPKVEEVKKKYANNKEEMGKAMLDLYKQQKVNPLSSCLPLIIQLPFLIAVFQVFRDDFSTKSMNLIYPFLHRPEAINHIAFGFLNLSLNHNIILAILAGVAQFWQAKMMMSKKPAIKAPESRDEDMAAIMNKQMMYMLPLMTAWFSYSFPTGLALYWLVMTLLSIAQQYYVFNQKSEPIKVQIDKGV
jgi:YidC/Oxa1 family membrane protein insertase